MQNMEYHLCLTSKIFLLEIKELCRFLKIYLIFFNLLVFNIRSLKQFRNSEQVNLYTYNVVKKNSKFPKKKKNLRNQ